MNKAKYYVLILVLLLVVGFLVMFSYYTQDFNVSYDFVRTVDYSDLEQTNGYSWDVLLGSVTLENNGYFQEKYSAPSLVACFEYAEDSSVDNLNPVYLQYDFATSSYSYKSDSGLSLTRNFQLPVNVEQTESVDIYAQIDQSMFTVDGLKIIAARVYEIPNKERNPFSSYFGSRSSYYYSCREVEADLDSIGTIAYMWSF